MTKRYVLFMASSDLTEREIALFAQVVESRYDPAKVIPVKGNRKAVILKTSGRVVSSLREEGGTIEVGEKALLCVLTSGAIGNLKRRASEAAAIGQVPQ